VTVTLGAILARCRLVPETGCRLWTGTVSSDGYGRLGAGRAHRLACIAAHGQPRTASDVACHSDACTTLGRRGRLCCEPTHLRWGGQSENATDRERVTRARRGRGAVLGARVS
jgi:hypothetical protein